MSISLLVGVLLAAAALGFVLYPVFSREEGPVDADQRPEQEPLSPACPSCGGPVQLDARFCSSCGRKLPAGAV